MALYHQVEWSSTLVALQGIHQLLLVYDPPRFYILLLLVSVSLAILVKAGFFNGDAGHSDGVGSGSHPGLGSEGLGDPGDGAYAVAVSNESDAKEELEIGIGIVEEELHIEQKSDHSDTEASPCLISQEPNMINHEDDEETAIEEGEELDVEELHKRAEAYICKVRMRFNTETV